MRTLRQAVATAVIAASALAVAPVAAAQEPGTLNLKDELQHVLDVIDILPPEAHLLLDGLYAAIEDLLQSL
jgi:hypothetical protein